MTQYKLWKEVSNMEFYFPGSKRFTNLFQPQKNDGSLNDKDTYEIANELGIPLNKKRQRLAYRKTTAKQAGKIGGSIGGLIGGQMVNEMVKMAQSKLMDK